MAKVIKEIIIMLLICLLAMLALAIAFYKYIPNKKVVPEVVTYVASDEIKDLLEDNIDAKSESDNVITTFEVTAGDLKGYQNTNVYVPGKANPFSVGVKSVATDNQDGTNNDGYTNNGNSSNTTDDKNKNPNNSNESTTPSIYQNKGTK